MSFLDSVKGFFSSKTVVEKAADGIYSGLDKAWHTSEEKEEDSQKRIELFMKLIDLTKNASPARRMIAMIVMSVWALVGLNIAILINISAFVEPTTVVIEGQEVLSNARIDLAIDRLTTFAIEYVAKPTALVLSFYFLNHVLKQFGGKKE